MTDWLKTARAASYTVPGFKFADGGELDLRLHYRTLGVLAPDRSNAVLMLHGTTGSSTQFLQPTTADFLFAAGQPLDVGKYFIILPDAIGHGGSSKPSDGLRMKFPQYDYADMIDAEYFLVKDGLGVHHLRLVTGNSMGGMETWLWAEKYPGFMDALVPMASQPTPMASRNWMLRRLMIETVRSDPEWNSGNYTTEPHSLKL